MAEEMLKGQRITPELIDEAAHGMRLRSAAPYDDHRASQEYRCDMIYAADKTGT